MDDDGTMMRCERLKTFAERHDLRIITVKDLIAYRMRHEKLVDRIAEFSLPTAYGAFRGVAYETRTEKDKPRRHRRRNCNTSDNGRTGPLRFGISIHWTKSWFAAARKVQIQT